MNRTDFIKAGIGLLLLSGCRASGPAKFSGEQSERIDSLTRELSGEPKKTYTARSEGLGLPMSDKELLWLERKVKREGLR